MAVTAECSHCEDIWYANTLPDLYTEISHHLKTCKGKNV